MCKVCYVTFAFIVPVIGFMWTVLNESLERDKQPKFIYLFGVLRRFQHCTGHITTGSWKGRGNQYIQLVKVLYCKLPTNGKQLPAFPLEAVPGTEPRPQRWEARVLPLCHHGPSNNQKSLSQIRYCKMQVVQMEILILLLYIYCAML